MPETAMELVYGTCLQAHTIHFNVVASKEGDFTFPVVASVVDVFSIWLVHLVFQPEDLFDGIVVFGWTRYHADGVLGHEVSAVDTLESHASDG